MPISFEGTIKEHTRVRIGSGFFDVSHMGRFKISINNLSALSSLICGDIKKKNANTALYSMILNNEGGVIDDIIIWKLKTHLILVCNASNTRRLQKLFDLHKLEYILLNKTTSLIAVQGPDVLDKLNHCLDIPDNFMCSYKLSNMFDKKVVIARTGYTGEDGIEILINHDDDIKLIDLLEKQKIFPCGLGARDTLRLEAGLPLYGQELNEFVTPIEVGFKWLVDFDHDFNGKDTLLKQLKTGNHKFLKKFVINDKIVARRGDIGMSNNIKGIVTSGNYSPILKKSIGFIIFDSKPESDLIKFNIRGKLIDGNLVKGKFVG